MDTLFNNHQSAQQHLAMLQQEHRELDLRIEALADIQTTSSLELSRLKKRKLALKDQITRLKSLLIPNLLA